MLFMLSVSLALVALSVQGKTDPYEGCVMVSILVHYFTLVAVMWMGAEALLMFQKLVIVFTRVTTKFIVCVSIICWSKCFSGLQKDSYCFKCINFISLSCTYSVFPYPPHCGCGYWK